MSNRGLLDADMATVGRWMIEGWRWWLDELTDCIPKRWQSAARNTLLSASYTAACAELSARRGDAAADRSARQAHTARSICAASMRGRRER